MHTATETSAHGSARDREIVAARVIVTSPGRNFVTLKIETRSGISGLGDATLNGRELAVASYLQDHVVPNLIGRDAGRIEDLWQFLYRGAYWRRGPVTMTAIAAVDVALWDILGKLAGLPVCQLLGGRSREGALVYAHANGRDIEEASDEVGKFDPGNFKGLMDTLRENRIDPVTASPTLTHAEFRHFARRYVFKDRGSIGLFAPAARPARKAAAATSEAGHEA